MGLDVSHDCFHGAYSAFNSLRKVWMKAAGLPPLSLMEGFYNNEYGPFNLIGIENNPITTSLKNRITKDVIEYLPIKWNCLKPNPLYLLLYHSDCDGNLKHKDCEAIAKSLEKIMSNIPENTGGGHLWDLREVTQKWINGLRTAAKKKQNVKFA